MNLQRPFALRCAPLASLARLVFAVVVCAGIVLACVYASGLVALTAAIVGCGAILVEERA